MANHWLKKKPLTEINSLADLVIFDAATLRKPPKGPVGIRRLLVHIQKSVEEEVERAKTETRIDRLNNHIGKVLNELEGNDLIKRRWSCFTSTVGGLSVEISIQHPLNDSTKFELNWNEKRGWFLRQYDV